MAAALDAARGSGRLLTSPAPGVATMTDAYAVQREFLALRAARGERLVGWKLGYTSAAMRAQMGVAEQNFGPLTDAMALSSPGRVRLGALQPRVEPELAVRLRRRLDPPCTVEDVVAACSQAYACLEVVDSVWANYRFRIEDNTADGSSAAWFVLGDPLPRNGWPEIEVQLLGEGARLLDEATGAAAGGHPALGVAWLAEQLMLRYGRPLEAGDIVLTGGLTPAVALPAGATVGARFTSRRQFTHVWVTR